MTTSFWRYGSCSIALLLAAPAAGVAQELEGLEVQAAPIEEYDENVEVLTSGPVHEAFASVMQVDPSPGIAVSAAPPELIEEIPPDVRPEGDVAWIPGYWAWDDDLDDFIWVSGVWRIPPPGYGWVPGYWEELDEGFQWISGYWASTEAEEVVYLPVPPESLEVGPSSPPPGEGFFWVPGHWVWRSGRYFWQPGYWAIAEPGWVWVPAYYAWSPGGCVYVGGYWDYPVRRRGLLFAPVRFVHPVYRRPAFRLVPRTLINTALLIAHFFTRPGYGHYYFGDYYAPAYYRRGIYPWYLYQNRGFGYDPLFWYYGSVYRGGYGAWGNVVRDRYRYFRSNEDFRPPRTFREQTLLVQRGGDANITNINTITMARSLRDALDDPGDPGVRLQRIDETGQQQLAETAREFRDYTRTRARLETRAARQRDADRADSFEPLRMRRPRPPLATVQREATADGRASAGADSDGRQSVSPPDRPSARRGERGERTARGQDRRAAARAAEDADPFAGAEIEAGAREADGRDVAEPGRRAGRDDGRGRQAGRLRDPSAADADAQRRAGRPDTPRGTARDGARADALDRDAAQREAARRRGGRADLERPADDLMPRADRGSAARRAGERQSQRGAGRLPGRVEPSELDRSGRRIGRSQEPLPGDAIRSGPAPRGGPAGRTDAPVIRGPDGAGQPDRAGQPDSPRSARRPPSLPTDPQGPAGVRPEQRSRSGPQEIGSRRGTEGASRGIEGGRSAGPPLPPQDRGVRGDGRPERSLDRPAAARRPGIESTDRSLDRPRPARRASAESMRPPQRQAPRPERRDAGRATSSGPAPAAQGPARGELRGGGGRRPGAAEVGPERPPRPESSDRNGGDRKRRPRGERD